MEELFKDNVVIMIWVMVEVNFVIVLGMFLD